MHQFQMVGGIYLANKTMLSINFIILIIRLLRLVNVICNLLWRSSHGRIGC